MAGAAPQDPPTEPWALPQAPDGSLSSLETPPETIQCVESFFNLPVEASRADLDTFGGSFSETFGEVFGASAGSWWRLHPTDDLERFSTLFAWIQARNEPLKHA